MDTTKREQSQWVTGMHATGVLLTPVLRETAALWFGDIDRALVAGVPSPPPRYDSARLPPVPRAPR